MAISFNCFDFVEKYEKKPFKIKHTLQHHPLLEREALKKLADELPKENIELNAGDVPAVLVEGKAPTHGLNAKQAIDSITECKTWVGLKKIEQVNRYKEIIDEVLDCLQPYIDIVDPQMYGREGFIFVSSPKTMTPYHMDPEHNFLFQLAGTKTFTIFSKTDRSVLSEEAIEEHYTGVNRKMSIGNHILKKGEVITLNPGEALHVPINSPHFVEVGDESSISLSITFRTPQADRREAVYEMNAKLRKMGIKPLPYGDSKLRDNLKLGALRAYRKLRGTETRW